VENKWGEEDLERVNKNGRKTKGCLAIKVNYKFNYFLS